MLKTKKQNLIEDLFVFQDDNGYENGGKMLKRKDRFMIAWSAAQPAEIVLSQLGKLPRAKREASVGACRSHG